MTPPMAAVVAGADPERAPKKVDATVATRARPPLILPKKAPARLSSLRDTPPSLMMFPARMKKGTAMRAKELPALNMFCTRTLMSAAPVMSTETMHESPSATMMGTPRRRNPMKEAASSMLIC
jgi:hypothetical protein